MEEKSLYIIHPKDENGNSTTQEIWLSKDQEREILNGRTAMQLYFDKIAVVIEDEDTTDEEIGKLFRAIYQNRRYGKEPDFPEGAAGRFLRSQYRQIATAFSSDDRKFIVKSLNGRANGSKGGRPPKKEEPRSKEPP